MSIQRTAVVGGVPTSGLTFRAFGQRKGTLYMIITDPSTGLEILQSAGM